MILRMNLKRLLCLGAVLGATVAWPAAAQFTINGVADRTTYTDSVTFSVATNAGYTYVVTLNGNPVAPGVAHTVRVMDYYDLAVRATQTAGGTVTSALRRFIVLSSNRGSPERGLVQWVPLPPIASTAAEMAGAQLHLMMPSSYPAGLEIPVAARVVDEDGNPQRVNGWVRADGFEGSEFRMLRGVGHGFLPPAAAGTVSYAAELQSLQAGRSISIDAGTAWTTVSGVLGTTTTWAPNSRIHVTGHLTIPAGATLTIGAGTVVRLNPGVNLTNSGLTILNGTLTQPVVLTATNRVAPEQHTGAWGGWIMRGGQLVANAAIMTGSGAAASMSFSPGSSHRSEQPLLFAHSSVVRMTNCALINNAGQIGNGHDSSIIWDHCLLQRAITCGEYDGGTNIIKDSALIEFPSVDGIYDADIADADFDGFYTINTTNYLVNSLFGFAKDDILDAGSGGPGSVVVSNCWLESGLHEAMAWSGEGRRTWTLDTVLMNSGQGLECGWSTGSDSPLVHARGLLSTANSVGARYGDNYEGTSGLGLKTGFLTVSNSFILHNYRDVWGQVWDNTWNYRVARMDLHDNYITAPNTNHPNNTIWDPAVDGPKLAAFMTTPPDAPVGIGIALWPNQAVPSMLTNGVPIRLSSFTTNEVSVNYTVATTAGTLAQGTLVFTAGETVRRITLPPATVQGLQLVQIKLSNPVGGQFTEASSAYLVTPPSPPTTTLVPYGSTWRYLDDGSNQGTIWRNPGFNDSGWSNGVAQLGVGDGDEAVGGLVRRTNASGATIATYYFRKSFNVDNPSQYGSFRLRLLRDDAGIVYLNGAEVLRSPNMPAGEVPYNAFTGGSAPSDNSVDTVNLVNNGSVLTSEINLVAAEVHQQSSTSSDMSFDLELIGFPAVSLFHAQFGEDWVLYWSDPAYRLECATSLPGGWQVVPGATSPYVVVPSEPQRFYRLRTP